MPTSLKSLSRVIGEQITAIVGRAPSIRAAEYIVPDAEGAYLKGRKLPHAVVYPGSESSDPTFAASPPLEQIDANFGVEVLFPYTDGTDLLDRGHALQAELNKVLGTDGVLTQLHHNCFHFARQLSDVHAMPEVEKVGRVMQVWTARFYQPTDNPYSYAAA